MCSGYPGPDGADPVRHFPLRAQIQVKARASIIAHCFIECDNDTSNSDTPRPLAEALLAMLRKGQNNSPVKVMLFSCLLAFLMGVVIILIVFRFLAAHAREPPAQSLNQRVGTFKWLLVLARIVTAATSISEGYDVGVVGGAHLLYDKALRLSPSQSSWMIAVLQFGVACGAPIGGALADHCGRRPALALSYVAMVTGSLIMASADSFLPLLAGRIMDSLGMGASLIVVTTYMTEVSPSTIRGQLCSLEEAFLVVGFALAYAANLALAGAPVGWRWMLGLNGAVPAALALPVLSGAIPESPRFLLLWGQKAEAANVLRSLVDQDEADRMLADWAAESDTRRPLAGRQSTLFPSDPATRRRLALCIGAPLLQALSGITFVSNYLTKLMAKEVGGQLGSCCMLLFSAMRLAFIWPTVSTIDTVGRRPLMLLSIAGASMAYILQTVFYWTAMPALPWKLFGFLLFAVVYTCGLGPVAWVYMGEVVETRARSRATALAICLTRVLAGATLLAFPAVERHINAAFFFLCFAVINLGSWCFVFMFLPETKSVALESMDSCFASK